MATEPLVHYHAPHTRSFTIRWLLEELGSPPHELKVLDIKRGDNKKPEYLAINPMGKVPGITHGGVPVTESAAIAIYLADLFPQAGLAPAIGDLDRAPYLRWIIFNQACVEPAVMDFSLKRATGSPGVVGYGSYDMTVDTLAGAVAKGPYILGNRFSAADVVVGAAIRWLVMFKLLPERPEFVGYVERLTKRPAFLSASEKDAKLAASLAA